MGEAITHFAALKFLYPHRIANDQLPISSPGTTRTSFCSSPMAALDNEISERRRIFGALAPYFGTVQPASFFRDTSAVVKGVKRIHPLIEGIYKPAGSFYPLSIASMLKSRYGDQLFHNPDRT